MRSKMTAADLSPERSAPHLVDAIFQARREERRDLQDHVVELTRHPSRIVREEALALLSVTWRTLGARDLLLELVRDDEDFGVRSRSAGALGLISTESTRQADTVILKGIVLDHNEHQLVRASAYEGLCRMHGRRPPPLDEDVIVERDVNLGWVEGLG